MKNRFLRTFLILLLVAVVGAGGVYAAARYGSPEDPLVTKSYLTDVVEKELTDQTDAQIRAAAGVFEPVQLTAGQTLSCEPGTEVVLTAGSATASGAFTDATLGEAVTEGAVAVNHLYLAGDNAVLTAAGDAALMVRGS